MAFLAASVEPFAEVDAFLEERQSSRVSNT